MSSSNPSVGDPFPDVALELPDGTRIKASDHAGKPLVVFFYPKDDTPGCTTEAIDFTSLKPEFDKAGVALLGISKDPPAKHAGQRSGRRRPVGRARHLDREAELRPHVHGHGAHDVPGRS
jgi:peroxiredoxin